MNKPSYLLLIERILVMGVLILLLYPVWVMGGTPVTIQWPMVLIAAALFMLFISFLLLGGIYKYKTDSVLCPSVSKFLLDPVVYLSGLFLLILAIQWWNAGRELVWDVDAMKWVCSPARYSNLPSAICRQNASEMLRWFLPSTVIICIVRHGLHAASIQKIALCQCISAALLATFGILQWLIASLAGVGVAPADGLFFTSFGYANHAGIYFVLMLCIIFRLILKAERISHRICTREILLYLLIALIISIGVIVTYSRAALILLWAVIAGVAVYFAYHSWHTESKTTAVDRVCTIAAALLVGVFLCYGFGKVRTQSESVDLTNIVSHGDELAKQELDWEKAKLECVSCDRSSQRHIAFQIWRDYPWFGAGGWSQSYLVGTYVAADKWDASKYEGLANTHCDPLQFLSEFGVVGFGLLVACALVMLVPVFRSGISMSLVGLVIVVLYSCVDLPFRSPAILYAWCATAAGLSVLESRKKSQISIDACKTNSN